MRDLSDSDVEKPDLRSIGEGLGFGNTAWTTSHAGGFTRPVVSVEAVDGETTTTNADSDSGNVTSETEELVDDAAEAKEEEPVEDKAVITST